MLTLPDVRLLTLLGAPGIGKTRLALHSAEVMTGHFRDGVWFVDLAPLTDAAQVLPAIAYALAVTEAGATPLIERLCATLVEQQLLLLLDNCEQVSAAATEIATLLRRCKGVKVLATSRTPLHLSAEHEYQVPPLSLPAAELPTDLAPENLMNYEAVQLFVARVQQHQQAFMITLSNAAPVVALCRRLEGIPLALELAAAALRRMSIDQLVDLLQTETIWLHQLYSPARDLPSRQRTLYQAIAWSYSLLDVEMKRVFRQLAVFVGGFGAQAAQAVCGADLNVLTLVTDHNLLAYRADRWHMLEMIREFALDELSRTEFSQERSQVQQRHTAYFVEQAAQPRNAQTIAPSTPIVPDALQPMPIAPDYDNFCAALTHTIAAGDGHAALTLCNKLGSFWETEGYLHAGARLTQTVLAMPTARSPHLRLAALERVSILAWQAHQFDIALAFAEQAKALAQENRQPETLARTLNLIGRIFLEQGDYDHAEVVLQECLLRSAAIPERFNPGCPLAVLGEVALARGERQRAESHLRQALTTLALAERTLYSSLFVAMAHTDLAELALLTEQMAAARHELRLAFPYARLTVRRLRCLVVALIGLLLPPLSAPAIPHVQTAAIFFGAVAGLGERTGDTLSPFHQRLIAERTTYAQLLLLPHEWQAAWQQGHAWTSAQAIAAVERWLMMDVME
ncbi:MAG: tetratricopeptide repeat protein [Caldilineaceae bacterium]